MINSSICSDRSSLSNPALCSPNDAPFSFSSVLNTASLPLQVVNLSSENHLKRDVLVMVLRHWM